MRTRRTLAAGAGAAVLGPVGYLLLFRRWCLTWGTSGDEVAAELPGDELLPSAGLVTTRAITPASRLFYLLFMEPGSLVMERKMLLGIKHRAEDTARQARKARNPLVGC